jgi:hypothetical protein
MSDEEFTCVQKARVAALLEKDPSAAAEAGRHWGKIIQRTLDFSRGLKTALVMSALTKKDVKDFFMRFIHPSGASRRKLSTQVLAMKAEVVVDKKAYVFPKPGAATPVGAGKDDAGVADAKDDSAAAAGEAEAEAEAEAGSGAADTLSLVATSREPSLLLEPRQLGQFKRTLAMSPAMM